MDAVKRGYTHPLLGDGVVALVNMSGSGLVDSEIVLHTTEIPLYAPVQIKLCTYTVYPGWWSRRTEVSSNDTDSTETKVASGSTVARWLSVYF